jgi:hypothetical protein
VKILQWLGIQKSPPLRFLPADGVMDTIYCKDIRFLPLPPPRPWVAHSCLHSLVVEYIRIDHRAGPGCFADNFEGKVCLDCGLVLEEVQTL